MGKGSTARLPQWLEAMCCRMMAGVEGMSGRRRQKAAHG